MKILFIGAHYDDIEVGCGGTLFRHVMNGDDIHIAITSSDEFRTGEPNERFKEQLKSLKIMNISKKNIYKFSYNDEVHNIVGELDKLSPNVVFTQFDHDTHQDHKRASSIGKAVGRKRFITTLFYDSGSSYDFYPNIFSIIDFEKKLKLIECYQSQIDSDSISLDIIKKKNAYWASLISINKDLYSEAFVSKKLIYKI